MDSEAPGSSEHLKLLCLSWRKIKSFAGRKYMAVADAGTLVGGRGSAGVSRAGLLIFLVCAAGLALLGSGSEAHVVEAIAATVAAPGGSGFQQTAVAGLAGGRSLSAEGRRASTAATGRGVGLEDRSGGGANTLAPFLPNLVPPLGELEISRVDYVPDVSGHFAEKQDLLDLIHLGWLQEVELVHQD
jgi:hypothetical protein